MHIELLGNNKIGSLFFETQTFIKGPGSVETNIHHESALYLTDCDVKVESIRGVFNAYLEMNNASLDSQRGVMFIFALTLIDSEITYPKGASSTLPRAYISSAARMVKRARSFCHKSSVSCQFGFRLSLIF